MKTLTIFILTLFQHGYKVRHSTLYHLLKGKRTGSMLIYGYFNHNLNYLGLLPDLKESTYHKTIGQLIKLGYLESEGPQGEYVTLTPLGEAYIKQQTNLPLTGIDSFLYSRIDEEFHDVLLFATQVVSEAVHGNRQYYPLEHNPQKQYLLRQWYRQHQGTGEDLGPDFFKEWHALFMLLPAELRDGSSLLLTGHQQVGLTFEQVVAKEDWDMALAPLLRKKYLHLFLNEIRSHPGDYPLFTSLYALLRPPLTNQSALRTYERFLAGETLTDLVNQRQIKLSTVSDHLIEGAILFADFPFERLLSPTVMGQLQAYHRQHPDFRHWRYRDCLAFQPDLSFLDFRLFQILQVRNEQDGAFRNDVKN